MQKNYALGRYSMVFQSGIFAIVKPQSKYQNGTHLEVLLAFVWIVKPLLKQFAAPELVR